MSARVKIGLDIGNHSIKTVIISNDSPPKLLSLGRIPSPQPGIVSDSELDLEAVAQAIKSLLEEAKAPVNDVVVALPESRVFTRVIYDLPYLSDNEVNQAIRYTAEEFVPMPITDVNINYQVIYRSQKGPQSRTVVFVVASPKVLIDKYLQVLKMAQLRPAAIETELIAIARSLVSNYSPATLLIQFGASTTDFAVVTDGLILLTRSVATGGLALTRAIAQSFNFEMVQAEEYKKTYGLLEDQLEGKLYQVLKPLIDVITTEARRFIQAFEAQNPKQPIKRVVITGGGAQMPGIIKYVADSLVLEVQEADPWASITIDPVFKSKLASEGPAYSVAVGLALKED